MQAFFSKKGRIYEFPKIDKYYALFLFRRLISFVIDLVVIISLTYAATIYMVDPLMKYLIGMIMGMAFATTYNLVTLYFMRGQTPGMKLTGLITVDYDGDEPAKFRLMTKGFIMGMYYFPFIGMGFILSSAITPFLLRGSTLVDVWTKTSVITVGFYNKIVKEENEIIDKERENE